MVFGDCRERPDLAKKSGYEYAIMDLVGLNKDTATLVKRTLYWKTYIHYIHKEIRELRGRVTVATNRCIIEGKHKLYVLYCNIHDVSLILIGLLTGKINVNEEIHLKYSTIGNDNSSTTNEDANSSNVEESISKLVELAVGDEWLIQLREDIRNLDLLQTCVNYCLFHVSTSMNWWYKAYITLVSDIFNDLDEALCMLLIENSASAYVKAKNNKTKISRKCAQPKYINMDDTSKKL